jgi:hypothetical protein
MQMYNPTIKIHHPKNGNTLDADTFLRNSDPVLLAFYNTKTLQLAGTIRNAEREIANLLANVNGNNIGDLYNTASDANADIVGGETWELNERDVNNWTLSILMNGITDLPTEEVIKINTLANTCPYIGGTAVYNARTLNALYHPNNSYIDRVLCVPQNTNKTSKSNRQPNVLINQDSLDEVLLLTEQHITNYLDVITKSEESIANIHPVKASENPTTIPLVITPQITPNPSNGAISITYNSSCNGILTIYNALGQIVQNFQLKAGNKRIETELQNVANGIYNFRFNFNKTITNGKLIIQK